jgi:hypothetical protein
MCYCPSHPRGEFTLGAFKIAPQLLGTVNDFGIFCMLTFAKQHEAFWNPTTLLYIQDKLRPSIPSPEAVSPRLLPFFLFLF